MACGVGYCKVLAAVGGWCLRRSSHHNRRVFPFTDSGSATAFLHLSGGMRCVVDQLGHLNRIFDSGSDSSSPLRIFCRRCPQYETCLSCASLRACRGPKPKNRKIRSEGPGIGDGDTLHFSLGIPGQGDSGEGLIGSVSEMLSRGVLDTLDLSKAPSILDDLVPDQVRE